MTGLNLARRTSSRARLAKVDAQMESLQPQAFQSINCLQGLGPLGVQDKAFRGFRLRLSRFRVRAWRIMHCVFDSLHARGCLAVRKLSTLYGNL